MQKWIIEPEILLRAIIFSGASVFCVFIIVILGYFPKP